MRFSTKKKFLLFGAYSMLVLGMTSTAKASNSPQDILLTSGDFSEPLSRETIESFLLSKGSMQLSQTYQSEIENPFFCPKSSLFCMLFSSRKNLSGREFVLTHRANKETIETYLDELSHRFDTEPKNTLLGIEENAVVIKEKSQPGKKLLKEKSAQKIAQAIEQSGRKNQTIRIELETESVEPIFSVSNPESLGLKEVIGEGTTNFRGSPKNRIYNIHRALEQFQGILIAPDEEFSFVDILGEVDGEHGYLPELVIKNNKTEPEFGGGICQVSSTAFRAAIYTGLKITERRNHAYPVQYYKPYGMDATIYIPKPDLRFKNNTGAHIFIQPFTEGTELTFQIFGSKDGRTVSIDGPHILESNPDGSMKTVFSQTVTNEKGVAIIKDSFWSNYKSPSLFPHPGEETLTVKPKDWSEKQWKNYKKIKGIS